MVDEALASVQQAVDQDGRNALAWARLAELHMASGNQQAALAAAKRAGEVNPELAKTQTVLGFANLSRMDTAAAKTASKSTAYDSRRPIRRPVGWAMMATCGFSTAPRIRSVICSRDCC